MRIFLHYTQHVNQFFRNVEKCSIPTPSHEEEDRHVSHVEYSDFQKNENSAQQEKNWMPDSLLYIYLHFLMAKCEYRVKKIEYLYRIN